MFYRIEFKVYNYNKDTTKADFSIVPLKMEDGWYKSAVADTETYKPLVHLKKIPFKPYYFKSSTNKASTFSKEVDVIFVFEYNEDMEKAERFGSKLAFKIFCLSFPFYFRGIRKLKRRLTDMRCL